MKNKKLLLALLVLPLTACVNPFSRKPLVIPNVDVENLEVKLPDLPTYNSGEIRHDETYDYIDMYEVSDFHGAVEYEEHSERAYLGLQKLATYLDEKRNSNKGGTLLLSSGDMFQGSADSNLTRGYMVNYAMHYMGFDAMAVGNHEFDWTEEWLKKNAELKYGDHQIPYLAANILKGSEIPSYLNKSTVIQRGAYKIGVIGVIGSKLEDSILKSAVAGFDFVPYGDIVSEEAYRLKKQEGCNAVVLLAHDQADKLETFNNVDGAFGGHAHDNYSVMCNGIPSIATENYGSAVAHMAFKFDKTTHEFVGVEDGYGYQRFTSSDSSIQNHTEIGKIMSQYAPEINKIKDIELGKCDKELSSDKSLRNLCTETMFESAVSFADTIDEVDSSAIVAAFTNHEGGIRDNIKEGKITYGNVFKCFPFDNEVVLFKATGAEIKGGIQKLSQLGCYRIFEKASYFDSNKEYWIATTDYLAFTEQISTFKELGEEDLVRTGKIVRDEIASKIYSLKKVKSEVYEANNPKFKSIPTVFF